MRDSAAPTFSMPTVTVGEAASLVESVGVRHTLSASVLGPLLFVSACRYGLPTSCSKVRIRVI